MGTKRLIQGFSEEVPAIMTGMRGTWLHMWSQACPNTSSLSPATQPPPQKRKARVVIGSQGQVKPRVSSPPITTRQSSAASNPSGKPISQTQSGPQGKEAESDCFDLPGLENISMFHQQRPIAVRI